MRLFTAGKYYSQESINNKHGCRTDSPVLLCCALIVAISKNSRQNGRIAPAIPNMISVSQLFMVIGIIMVLHSAYSCLHYRELLRDLEESGFEDAAAVESLPLPPMDVIVEVITGALLILISELVRTGSSLQPVTSKGGFRTRPVVAPAYRTREFDTYTSRARAFQ